MSGVYIGQQVLDSLFLIVFSLYVKQGAFLVVLHHFVTYYLRIYLEETS